nr:polysaccharide pyruvyl transferase family protein [uncultured Acetatifactor sp.]
MEEDKVIVWGTGAEAKKLIEKVGMEQIVYFADNNVHLWGKYFFEKRILSPEEISTLPKGYQIVISTVKYENEIRKQLQGIEFHNFISGRQYTIKCIFNGNRPGQKRIILLNTHDNVNVGDHAITIAELYFFRKYLPEYEVVEVPLSLCTKEMNHISQFITREDLLIVTGGGFLGSLWLTGGERNVRKIVRQFPGNRIVVFPQTMYFENNAEGRKQREISRRIYNSHKNLTFCFRDVSSYNLGNEILDDTVQKRYVPDMVTLLDRSSEIYPRKDALICIRKDREGIVSGRSIEEIEMFFQKNSISVNKMSMLAGDDEIHADRMDLLNMKLHQMQTSRIVVTDRLHCMLLCAVSGTPCLAFDNISGKVQGGYDWINEIPYIRFVRSDMSLERELDSLLNMHPMAYENKSVEKEFEKLADFLKAAKVRI